ncbi:MAG: hypothetical protein LUG62_03395 [Clostridiales bacterium]|nr:hypothetical protein [Clostridiales bacterium]
MKTGKKKSSLRVLSLLLMVMMLCTLIPTSVFAETVGSVETEAASQTVTGTMTSSSRTKWYQFTVSKNTRIKIYTKTASHSQWLNTYVYNASRSSWYCCFSTSDPSNRGYQDVTGQISLNPGTYYLKLTTGSANPARYSLSMSTVSASSSSSKIAVAGQNNTSRSNAVKFTPGYKLAGAVISNSSSTVGHYYKFTLSSTKKVTLKCAIPSTATKTTYFQVLKSSGSAAGSVVKCTTSSRSKTWTGTLSAGTYYVRVSVPTSTQVVIPYTINTSASVVKKSQTISATTSYTKYLNSGSFYLDAKITTGNGTLSYSSSNTSVATVNSAGKVTLKGTGTTTITVTASATSTYKKATKTITVKVVSPKATKITSLTSPGTGRLRVYWNTVSGVTGYQIQVSRYSSFSSATATKLSGASTTGANISSLYSKKGYYVRVRTYKTISGKTYYSSWSSAWYCKTK